MNYIHLDPYPLRIFNIFYVVFFSFSKFTHLYETRNFSVIKRPYIYGSLRKSQKSVNFGFHAVELMLEFVKSNIVKFHLIIFTGYSLLALISCVLHDRKYEIISLRG